ncbi:unnamed protein product [Phytomonas sp. Hart1]|nr:unnamed protein product [Phytomonas sp. Hart1]|eukprot:CCW67631.1 unnamed protein product [Phytomonas sp. isolate Hart1]
MADIAKAIVFTSSKHAVDSLENTQAVVGPSRDFSNAAHILSYYKTLGFQATHFAQACEITQRMFEPQPPSKNYIFKEGEFVESCLETSSPEEAEGKNISQAHSGTLSSSEIHIYPTIFLGMTANLLGTGCREALQFLLQEGVKPRAKNGKAVECSEDIDPNNAIDFKSLRRIPYKELITNLRNDRGEEDLEGLKERISEADQKAAGSCRMDSSFYSSSAAEQPLNYSFLSAIVVSGGGMEHDLRRACEAYRITEYVSEEISNKRSRPKEGARCRTAMSSSGKFGNIIYGVPSSDPGAKDVEKDYSEIRRVSLFDVLMRKFIAALLARQERLQKETNTISSNPNTLCAITPSEIWALAGIWLEDLMEDALLEVAKRTISTTNPENKADSELCHAIRKEAIHRARSTTLYWAALQEVPIFSPSLADGDIIDYIITNKNDTLNHNPNVFSTLLKLDLVRDLSLINRMAMFSKCTGMIICGGGVIKHHIANANLMRNGADYAVYMSNSHEFDGSDAGARPDEAVSWGKIRIDGRSVKVFGEITTIFPLLVALVFLPLVRQAKERELSNKRT